MERWRRMVRQSGSDQSWLYRKGRGCQRREEVGEDRDEEENDEHDHAKEVDVGALDGLSSEEILGDELDSAGLECLRCRVLPELREEEGAVNTSKAENGRNEEKTKHTLVVSP